MVVSEIVEEVGNWAKDEIKAAVEIVECEDFPAFSDIFTEARKWLKIEDVVVVVGDLAASTKLSLKRHTKTSCRIYEAATGGAARILTHSDFRPEFVDIQGDGLFALYHGERAYERAFCAATTLRTWSETMLVPRIEAIDERMPKTGFKVGMARGVLAVKNVGVPRTDHKEPVWAGKPVNWAFKCAQAAERHRMIVTEHVHAKLKANDFVRFSCGCDGKGNPGRPVSDLWSTIPVPAIGDDSFACHRMESKWCSTHGDEFCEAILDARKSRDDVPSYLRT